MKKTILTIAALGLGILATGCTKADHIENNVNRLHNRHVLRDAKTFERDYIRNVERYPEYNINTVYDVTDNYERSMAVPYGTKSTGLYASKNYKNNKKLNQTVNPIPNGVTSQTRF